MSIASFIANPIVKFLAQNSQWDFENNTARRRNSARLVSQDTDLNYGTREEMMAEARVLCQTFGLASRILRQYANYCVGSCEIDFNSGDANWDAQAEEFWRQHCSQIDVSGRFNLRSLGRMAVMSMLRDGDIGIHKTMENGFPQVQAIEADRIRNNTALLNVDQDKTLVGGVKVDGIGRAQFYRVFNRAFNTGWEVKYEDVPASDFLLLRDPDRFDGVRGVTHFSRGALNHMRDLKEILEAEKRGVKIHSRLALLIKKLTGGTPAGSVKLFGAKSDGSGNQFTEEVPDGQIKYLLPGEDVVAFQSNRPSPTFAGFLEFLIRDIAISFDLPLGFVWQMVGTGPAVRLDSKQAERTFLAKIDLLEWQFLNPLAAWVLNWAMTEGKRLPFNKSWHKFEFTRPSHPSIDVGRESAADLDEHERGMMAGCEITAARGKNVYKVLESKAKEARAALDLAEKYDVPVEMIMAFSLTKPEAEIDAQQQQLDQNGEMLKQKQKQQTKDKKKA